MIIINFSFTREKKKVSDPHIWCLSFAVYIYIYILKNKNGWFFGLRSHIILYNLFKRMRLEVNFLISILNLWIKKQKCQKCKNVKWYKKEKKNI